MIFKKGDFVRVKDTTHDASMPTSRLGHLIKKHQTISYNIDKEKAPTRIWKVFMTNGNILIFHEMFLEHASGAN